MPKENTSSYERTAYVLQRIHEVTTTFVETTDLNQFLNECISITKDILLADTVLLQLVDETGLKHYAHLGLSQNYLDFFSIPESRMSLSVEALLKGERVVVEDIENSMYIGTASYKILKAEKVKSVQSSPLIDHNKRLIGVLSNHWKRPFRLSEEDKKWLDLLCRQLANFITIRRNESMLKDQLNKLESMNKYMINRELKMIELKKELDSLKDAMQDNA